MKTKGVRKKNQFQVVITTTDQKIDEILKNITMWTTSCELPERGQEFTEMKYQGYPFQVPTTMTMGQELTMTIKSDGKGELRRACLAWQAKISNPAISDGSIGEGDKKIPSDAIVRILCYDDNMEKVIETYKLIGVAVEKVGSLEFSNDEGDVAEFELALKFQWWEIEEVNEGEFTDIR